MATVVADAEAGVPVRDVSWNEEELRALTAVLGEWLAELGVAVGRDDSLNALHAALLDA